MDAATQRGEKIARFQRDKAIRAELQRLQEMRSRGQALEQVGAPCCGLQRQLKYKLIFLFNVH